MAKRGRPRKVKEQKLDNLKKEKEVQDFVSDGIEKSDNIDISDVDYQQPKKDSISENKSPLGESYNPFSESVEEKPYRTVKTEDSPMINDIAEPVFERPSFQDLLKENEQQVEEDGIGGEGDAFSQDEIRELPDKQKEDSAKGLVEQSLNIYALGCKGLGKLGQIKESKVDKLAKEGVIDLNLRIPIDAHSSVSIPQVVQGFNNEIEDTFRVDEDFKDSVRPAMTRVFIKRGWGMTDEQQLMLAFGMDLAQKSAILMKLRKEGEMQVQRFVDITNKARGKNVKFVAKNQPVEDSNTPEQVDTPEVSEVQIEEEKPTRKKKQSKVESKMVNTINPDIKIKQSDLDQVDVDNV